MQRTSLFDDQRLQLDGAIELSLASLQEYGRRYRHWCVAYSGGKDSSATVTLICWAIKTGRVSAPDSLTILYADTRMELPPLQKTAMQLLATLRRDGFNAQVVLPEIDNRFFVYMLGYGVPPSSNTFRWCTPKIKVEPMHTELGKIQQQSVAYVENVGYQILGDEPKDLWRYYQPPPPRFLMLTGVRQGESAARDQRIAVSCSKDSGECGQGWFQVGTPEDVADTLAPLLHWRLCHIYDWLYLEQDRHGYDVSDIALIYGDGEVRTGCVGCPLASRDVALERLVKQPGQERYKPLLELKPLYRELKKPQYRLRKSKPEIRKDGKFSKNAQRLGPLTFEARRWATRRVLDIQKRAGVDLINSEELTRIVWHWRNKSWPQGWSGNEVTGDVQLPNVRVTKGNEVVVQPILLPSQGGML